MINEYKILIVFIVFSVIVGLIILILYLENPISIVLFSLLFGIALGVFDFLKMVVSLKSEVKWSVIVDSNSKHEGIFELILMIVLIIVGIIAIVTTVEFL